MKKLVNLLAINGVGSSAFVRPAPTSSSHCNTSLRAKPRGNAITLNGTDIHSIEAHELLGPWTPRHDWLLSDIVPRYTVKNEKHIATSWGQIRSKPAFRDFSEDELKGRHDALVEGSSARERSGENLPVVHDWWVERGNVVRGTVDGRSVWFTARKGGAFEEAASPERDIFSANGFVEASDDSIYELGVSVGRGTKEDAAESSAPFEAALGAVAKESRRSILVAILASSLVSGGLAFNIGEAMGSYSQMIAARSPTVSSATIVVRPAAQSVAPQPLDANREQSEEVTMLSISEQRARQELRVIREKKAMAIIDERLKVDEQKLSELQREETRMEGERLGFY